MTTTPTDASRFSEAGSATRLTSGRIGGSQSWVATVSTHCSTCPHFSSGTQSGQLSGERGAPPADVGVERVSRPSSRFPIEATEQRMSIRAEYGDGVFAPLEEVDDFAPGEVCHVLSDSELKRLVATAGWLWRRSAASSSGRMRGTGT